MSRGEEYERTRQSEDSGGFFSSVAVRQANARRDWEVERESLDLDISVVARWRWWRCARRVGLVFDYQLIPIEAWEDGSSDEKVES